MKGFTFSKVRLYVTKFVISNSINLQVVRTLSLFIFFLLYISDWHLHVFLYHINFHCFGNSRQLWLCPFSLVALFFVFSNVLSYPGNHILARHRSVYCRTLGSNILLSELLWQRSTRTGKSSFSKLYYEQSILTQNQSSRNNARASATIAYRVQLHATGLITRASRFHTAGDSRVFFSLD